MLDTVHGKTGWRSTPLGELLGGSAFRPHPEDAGLPLTERLQGLVVLLVIVARDRAACLRVTLHPSGPCVSGTPVQVSFRQAGDLASTLKAEAQASGALWVVYSVGTGWQAQVCSRSARGIAGEDPFEGHRLLREQPELFLSKPQSDQLYALVDHPWLDRSIVFGVRRREVEALVSEATAAGLRVASLKIGPACLLEQAIARTQESLLDGDLLVSDGLGVLLLKIKDGDFARDMAGELPGGPRQASNRPNDLGQDLLRFVRDNGNRPLQFIVPSELQEAVTHAATAQGAVAQLVCEDLSKDPSLAVFSGFVRHDLGLSLSRQRAALPAKFKPFLSASLSVCALGFFVFAAMILLTEQENARIGEQQARMKSAQERLASAAEELKGFEHDQRKAGKLVQWFSHQAHAQALLLRLLEVIPSTVTLERLAFQVEDGGRQLILDCHLSGGEPAQIAVVRSLEQVVATLGYRIGERPPPVVVQRALHYRWRLIMPLREGARP